MSQHAKTQDEVIYITQLVRNSYSYLLHLKKIFHSIFPSQEINMILVTFHLLFSLLAVQTVYSTKHQTSH